jgi:hypothetical protein
MTVTEELRALRAIARTIYGEAAPQRVMRLATAHEAADAEFDGYLAEYRNSDAKAAHDRQEAAGLAMLALMGEEFLNDYLNGEVDCD